MGNLATVVLMSLHKLYKALEVLTAHSRFYKRISHRPATGDVSTVGPASQNRFRQLLALRIDQSANEDQTTFEFEETDLSPKVGI